MRCFWHSQRKMGRKGCSAHPCVCCMTSGAMKQGVPQKVLRARYFCAAQALWKCPLPLPPQLPPALLGLSAQPHAWVHSLVQRHVHLATTGGCQVLLCRPGTLEVPAAAAASARGTAGALCKQQRPLPLYAYTHGVVSADVILFSAAPFTRADITVCARIPDPQTG